MGTASWKVGPGTVEDGSGCESEQFMGAEFLGWKDRHVLQMEPWRRLDRSVNRLHVTDPYN